MPKSLNIKFPLQESPVGYFLDLTSTTQEQVKSEIALLLMVGRGDLRYKPNFGLNMHQFLFQQLDDTTKEQITEEIKNAMKNNLNNVEVKDVSFYEDKLNHQFTGIKLTYFISDGIFKQQDSLELIF